MNRRRDYFTDMFDVEGSGDQQYLNNTNFVPSFVSDLTMSGSYITDVGDYNNDKFFRFEWDSRDGNWHIPVVQVFGDPNVKSTVNEWYPNTRTSNSDGWTETLLPMMDLKEMFIRNANVLNRFNILSTDASGRMYYAYYGTTYEDSNKNIVHLGTGTTDINLGLKTLTTVEERSHFNAHTELDIDFASIVLNGDVTMPKAAWAMYQRPGTNLKLYSTRYEMAYIGLMPATIMSLSQVAGDSVLKNDLPYFRMSAPVSETTYIGQDTRVEGKNTFVSYLNVNWLLKYMLKIGAFEDILLKPNAAGQRMCDVHGDADKLFYVVANDNTVAYFLKLTTDIADMSQRLSSYEFAGQSTPSSSYPYYIRFNPLSISYTANYVDKAAVNCTVNIREEVTTNSTAYMMYDGGDLADKYFEGV